MLIWKAEYAIGIELIDKQHEHLFEIGNDIYNLLNDKFSTDKYDRIIQVINDLKEYTKYHFRCEEDYMLQINYKKYFSQKIEHDDFIDKISNLSIANIDEDPDKHINDILTFIFEWVLEHILNKDKQIKASTINETT